MIRLSISLAFIFCFLSLIHISGQVKSNDPNAKVLNPKANEAYIKARRMLTLGRYDEALKYAELAMAAAPDFLPAYQVASSVYSNTKRPAEERKIYEAYRKVVPENIDVVINLAKLDMDEGKYQAAIDNYTFIINSPATPANIKTLASDRVRRAQLLLKLENKKVDFNPVNLGANINSRFDEYYPTFTVDGQTIYFTRRKVTKAINDDERESGLHLRQSDNEDILYSTKDSSGKWRFAQDVPDNINTSNNEGAMCISPDGSFMIFTRCSGDCDLYISQNINGHWSRPKNLGEPVNSRFYETNPSISADGMDLYFAAARPNGYGNTDIYVSHRDENFVWSEPKNLGPEINTSKGEWSPFIHPDNKTLYFSSDGWPGFGKRDIFYSRKNSAGTAWDTAQNLGYGINGPREDLGLVAERTGRNGYIFVDNEKSFGGLDIFEFELPEYARAQEVNYLKGVIYDEVTKKPISGSFQLIDLSTGKVFINKTTEEDGKFLIAIPVGRDYLVNVAKKGYLFYSGNIPLSNYTGVKPYEKDIPLQPIEIGKSITLRNIFFKTDDFALRDESFAELGKVIEFLKDNPTVRIEIGGHTDNTGTALHNKELSLKRAKSVYDYLIKQGKIPGLRLRFAGYGDSKPMAENNTPEGKAMNRRTEMLIIK